MSQENVEIVREVYEAWSRGDFRSHVHLLDQDLVYVIRPEFPDSGTYAGLEEVAQFFQSWLEPWQGITISAEEFLDAGESIVAAVRQEGIGRRSGVPGELRFFQIWTFRGGKVIRLDAIRARADALEAAGLSE